jgi:hypothetical protein
VDGRSPNFESLDDEVLMAAIERAEMDLRLSRNDAARSRRTTAFLDAARMERWRRLEARIGESS